MLNQYYLDLEDFSMERFRNILENTELFPARQILKENTAEIFGKFNQYGIVNLKALITLLSTKKKIKNFSTQSGISVNYLTILLRQARSYIPKLIYLKDIPGVKIENIARLEAAGIRNTKQLFGRSITVKDREMLSSETGVPLDDLLPLVSMSDLARILGLGPVFVRLYYDSGIDSLHMLSQMTPHEIDGRLRAANSEKNLARVIPGLKDFAHSIQAAKELAKIINFDN